MPSKKIKMNYLSLIICTHNRANTISNLINYFDAHVFVPKNLMLEILVVDNHSTDSTRQVIELKISSYRLYNLRYIYEKALGLSNARNKGIKESKHLFIGFLDDDSVPEKDYLFAITDALEKYQNVQCFSHRVINIPEILPVWYRLDGKYRMINRGNYDLGDRSRFLNEFDQLPIGSGMIFCKNIFEKYGNFDPRFGYDVTKSMLIPGEETELFLKIIKDNVPIYYIHNAIVKHYPKSGKYDLITLCKTYLGIGYWYGRKDALNKIKSKITSHFGFPIAYYKRLFLVSIFFAISRCTNNITIKNYYLFQLKKIWGQFLGYKEFKKIANQ